MIKNKSIWNIVYVYVFNYIIEHLTWYQRHLAIVIYSSIGNWSLSVYPTQDTIILPMTIGLEKSSNNTSNVKILYFGPFWTRFHSLIMMSKWILLISSLPDSLPSLVNLQGVPVWQHS